MSKPVRDIDIRTKDGKRGEVQALIDSGSFYTIIRQDCLPKGTAVVKYKTTEKLGMAGKTGQIRVVAETGIIMRLEGHPIQDTVFISPDLKREFIIGAKTMQAWDITIKNKNGHTAIHVGHDMNDPDVQAVE